MTVSELIEQLQKCDPDARVMVWEHEDTGSCSDAIEVLEFRAKTRVWHGEPLDGIYCRDNGDSQGRPNPASFPAVEIE